MRGKRGTSEFRGEVLRLEQIHRDLLEIDLVRPARGGGHQESSGRMPCSRTERSRVQTYLQKMMTARQGCDHLWAYTLIGDMAGLRKVLGLVSASGSRTKRLGLELCSLRCSAVLSGRRRRKQRR